MHTRALLCIVVGTAAVLAGCSDKKKKPAPPPPPAVSISTVTPVQGPDTGGTTITITGTAFDAGTTVTIQGSLATGVTLVSSAQLTCVTPVGTAGAADVVVTITGGTSATATAGFTYYTGSPPAPTVTSLTPTSGPATGGTFVTVNGTGFQTGATVTVGGVAATNVVVATGGKITFTTPAGTAGNATIVITNPGPQAVTVTNGFVYGTPTPVVTAVAPTSGPVAGGTLITVSGTGFEVSGAQVPTVSIGGLACTGVQVQNATQLTATTAAATVVGPQSVQVTNPNAQSGALAGGYTYVAPSPTITGLSPSSGPQGAGTLVTLTGTNFYAGATVTFGASPATGVTVSSATQIVCTAPAGTGTVTVTLTNLDANSGTNSYTYNPPPSITAINPTNGPATIATGFTITGSNFIAGATVDFGGSLATGLTITSGQITGTAPTGSGTVTVTVTNPDTQTATVGYTYNPPPSITAINPTSGPATLATAFTITGSNFSGSTVTFGGSAATGLSVSATQITGTAPTGTGTVTVTVTNTDTQTATIGYTYNPPPSITAINPTNGAPAGGNAFTITGSNFVAGATVTFGANPVSSPTVGATQITGTVPAGAVGGVTVTVTNPDTQSTTTSYTYNAAPTISSINPGNGPATIPTAFTIAGTGFIAGATVDFGGSQATGLTVTGTQITGTTPLGSGTVTVTVTNPDTQSATTSYTFDPPPSITVINPTNGPGLGGALFTITGSNFVGSTVTFGASAATGLTVLSGQIDGTTPAGTGTVTVTVTNSDGQSATTSYTYNPPPSITSINPTNGVAAGGNGFTIAGSSFLTGATVTFGSNAVSSPTVSATQITGTVPAYTSGPYTVTVTVTNPDSQTATISYTYNPAPTVTAITPSGGPESGGQLVTIDGTGFINGATVTIGGSAATGVIWVNATRLTALTPSGTPATVNVTVTNPDTQAGTLFTAYTYRTAQTHVLTGSADWQQQDREGTDHTTSPGDVQLTRMVSRLVSNGTVVTVIAYDAQSSSRIIVGTNSAGAFVTTNGGTSWTAYNQTSSPALPSNHVRCAEFHSPSGGTGTTFGIGTDRGLALTNDGGASFRLFTTSSMPRLEGPIVEGLDFYDGNAAPTHWIVAANSGTNLGGGGAHWTQDGGHTFTLFNATAPNAIASINGNWIRDVAYSPNSALKFLIAGYSRNTPDAFGQGGTGGIYLTSDGGATAFTRFTHVTFPTGSRAPSEACCSVAFDPADTNGQTWLAGFDTHRAGSGGVYHTANDGANRVIYNTGSTPALPSNDVRDVTWGGSTTNTRFLVATEGGLVMTTNANGAPPTFTTYTTGSSPAISDNFVNAVSWVPGGAVFGAACGTKTATSVGGGADVTGDTGGTFSPVANLPAPHLLAHANVTDVAVFDGDGTGNRILVGTGGGAALSLDGGATWTLWTTSSSPALPSNDVRSVAWWEASATGTNAVIGTAAGAVVVTGIGTTPAFTVLTTSSTPAIVSNDVRAVDYFSGSGSVNDDILVGTSGGVSYVTGALTGGAATVVTLTTSSSPNLPSNTVNAVAFFHGQTGSGKWAVGTASGLVLTANAGTSISVPTLPGSGPGQAVNSVAYWNGGSTGNEILVGTGAGAALNTGGGSGAWTAFNPGNGLFSTVVTAVKFLDAGSSASAFACGCAPVQLSAGPPPTIQAGGLCITTNGGSSWATRLQTSTSPALAVDDVWAFDFDDSVAGGTRWVLGHPAVNPTDTGGVLINTGATYRAAGTITIPSIEGGVFPRTAATAPTWDDRFTRGVAGKIGSGSNLVVAGPYGIAATTDGGTSFTVANEATTPAFLSGVVLATAYYSGSTTGETWLAATPAGLYRTTNGGTSFTLLGAGNGLPTPNVRGMAFHHGVTNGQLFAVATSSGLAVTTNGGTSFTVFNGGNGLTNDCRDVDFYDTGTSSGSIRCVVATGSGVYVCTDMTTGSTPTATWTQRTASGNSLASDDVWAVRYEESQGAGANFWAGCWFSFSGVGGLSRTTNHGSGFTNSLPYTFVWDIDVHPGTSSNIIAGLVQGVAVSTNSGSSFTLHNRVSLPALPSDDCRGVSFWNTGSSTTTWLAATEEGTVLTTNGNLATPTFSQFRKGTTSAYSRLHVTETTPAGTAIRYQFLDANWVPIPDATLSGNSAGLLPDGNGDIDLTAIPVGTNPVIQVRAILSTTNPTATPALHDLTLIYEY